MVLVELDVGKHHAPRHSGSTFYYLFLSWWLNSDLLSYLQQRLTLEGIVARVGSKSCSTTAQGYILWDWKLKHDVNNKFIIWLSTCLLLQRTKTWEKQLTSAGLDADHFVITASSIAERVTTILHPFYEAYLLKLFSHFHLLLYTEDLVVLESVFIRSRGGRFNPETDYFSELPHGWLPPISLHSWSIYLASWTLFSSDLVPFHHLLCLKSATGGRLCIDYYCNITRV